MIRTQIQLPDELYREAKKIAETKEISLAELTRRGLEYIISTYPHDNKLQPWQMPEPLKLGWKGLDHSALKNAIQADEDIDDFH